jgi:hypothetical protein
MMISGGPASRVRQVYWLLGATLSLQVIRDYDTNNTYSVSNDFTVRVLEHSICSLNCVCVVQVSDICLSTSSLPNECKLVFMLLKST